MEQLLEIKVLTIAFSVLCFIASVAYVFARWKGRDRLAAAAKVFASTAFIVTALLGGAMSSNYGRLILVGLILSWFGDVFLLSLRSRFLLAGMAAFLFAHLAFIAAFVTVPLSLFAAIVISPVTIIMGAALLMWLWPHLKQFYKIAVPLYLATIGVMIILAVSASAAALPVFSGLGAILFAISDVSVARDRFVERSIRNKIWGIPLYYMAQILLAFSVQSI